MKEQVSGFLDFVREQGVVGLAVGLAIGTAAGATVKQIVDSFINPLVAILTRGIDLAQLKWVIFPADVDAGQVEVAIGYGAIVSSFVTLIATAFVVYWLVRVLKFDRIDKKKKNA
jgi:large conductance mechanosensitive channel